MGISGTAQATGRATSPGRSSCRIYHNTTQSVADNTIVTVAFNSERKDPTGMHDPAANTRVTILEAGDYAIAFHAALAAGADYTRIIVYLIVDGTTVIARQMLQQTAVSTEPYLSVATVYDLAVGQYVEAQIYQDNTANAARNLLSSANFSPELAVARIGLG